MFGSIILSLEQYQLLQIPFFSESLHNAFPVKENKKLILPHMSYGGTRGKLISSVISTIKLKQPLCCYVMELFRSVSDQAFTMKDC